MAPWVAPCFGAFGAPLPVSTDHHPPLDLKLNTSAWSFRAIPGPTVWVSKVGPLIVSVKKSG